MRRVRVIVDLTSSAIMQGRLPRRDAETLVSAARARILDLFPGREHTYELLYARRFRRLLDEFARPQSQAGRSDTIIPFPTDG